jgi:hypothetical protein
MKKVIFLVVIFCSISLSAQLRNRNNGYPNTNSRDVNAPKFKPAELAGLLEYDVKKACKKSGVKQQSDLGKKVTAAIEKYNKSIRDIKRINTFSLNDLKASYDAAVKMVEKTKDISNMSGVRKKMRVVIDPIRKETSKKDSILNVDLKALLSKKQLKKWVKYANGVKKKMKPKFTRQPRKTINPNRRRGY